MLSADLGTMWIPRTGEVRGAASSQVSPLTEPTPNPRLALRGRMPC